METNVRLIRFIVWEWKSDEGWKPYDTETSYDLEMVLIDSYFWHFIYFFLNCLATLLLRWVLWPYVANRHSHVAKRTWHWTKDGLKVALTTWAWSIWDRYRPLIGHCFSFVYELTLWGEWSGQPETREAQNLIPYIRQDRVSIPVSMKQSEYNIYQHIWSVHDVEDFMLDGRSHWNTNSPLAPFQRVVSKDASVIASR